MSSTVEDTEQSVPVALSEGNTGRDGYIYLYFQISLKNSRGVGIVSVHINVIYIKEKPKKDCNKMTSNN